MTRTPAVGSAREASRLLHELVQLYHEARAAVHDCCPETSAQECEALALLHRTGPLAGGQFAAQMGLEKTWGSRLVQRLVDRGLVRQLPDPADSRRRLVELTARGRSEARALENAIDRCATAIFDRVPPGERRTVQRALALLRDALAAACDEGCGLR
jgi:DNA-binding MarR family transcriptional regulator